MSTFACLLVCASFAGTSATSDTQSLVQMSVQPNDDEDDRLELMEVDSEEVSDQEEDLEDDPVSKDFQQLLSELREMHANVKQAKASANSGPAPGFPDGSTVGSLEPLAGPLADQTWRIAKHAQRVTARTLTTPLSGLDEMTGEITGEINGFIKDGVADMQKKIDERLARVKDLATSVSKLKPVADANDKSLYSCRKQQLAMAKTYSSVAEALAALKFEKEKVCAARDVAKYFNWTVRPGQGSAGMCDFPSLNGKKCTYSMIAENVRNLTQEHDWARKNYFDLKGQCQTAMDAIDRQLAMDTVQAVPSLDFSRRKEECDLMETKFSLAMCAFGDRLQEKCSSVDALKELTTRLNDRRGSLQSLHYASQELKCALMDLKAAQDDNQIFQPCLPKSFETLTGGFNIREKEVEMLTAGKYFTCEDQPVEFFGKRMQISNNADYEIPYTPVLTVRPLGTFSFDMCQPFFTMTTTTTTITTTSFTSTTPQPNTTTSTMLAGFP